MGGNALSHCTRRYQRQEYFELTKKLQSALEQITNTRVALIPAYTSKESFGDADFLVKTKPDVDVLGLIKNQFNDSEFVKNGNVLSIAMEELQVDLIATDGLYFQSSLDYFSYNDLHNLTGRLLHKLGIKHGHKGLSLVVRHKDRSDHILKEIFLEHMFAKEKAYEILGLDVNFIPETEDDIYKFVASSKFFDPDIFLLENRNNDSRTRDKKRKIYNGFLEWCRDNPDSKKFSFPEKNERGGHSLREPFYTDIVLKMWPWVEHHVNELMLPL